MFAFTKAQQAIRKAARDFAKGELDKDTIIEWEKSNTFPEGVWQKASDLGFVGNHFPEEYSGGGLGILDTVLILEELCRKDSTVGVALANASHACEILVRHGSEDLKEKFLPKVTEGEILSSGAFGETQRGVDFTQVDATAVKQGGQWLINGTKTHVPNGGTAGFYLVLCRTDPDAGVKKGTSLILVEADREGLSFENNGRRLGANMTPSSTMMLTNVQVPEDNLLGGEGEGIAQVESFMRDQMILLAAQALGSSLGAYDRMLEYVKGREQFGKKIAQFQASQHKIADMATQIELAALVTYKAAWTRDQGKADASLCAMAKMSACKAAVDVGAHTIQLFGGYGYMTEYEVERFYRDAKTLELTAGASASQMDIIACNAIGRIR